MKALFVHNAYRHPGGEDACVANEVAALRAAGVDVHLFTIDNRGAWAVARDACFGPWGWGAEAALEREVLALQPDVVHVHNLYPRLSARLFQTTSARAIPTVMTLHNFRPLCLNGLFLTPALEMCERCAEAESFRPGVARGCYRGSRWQSGGLALHLARARRLGWYGQATRFIAPSDFLKQRFVAHGFSEAQIVVQPHFVPDIPPDPPAAAEPYLLYLGRLSDEKGLRWLLRRFDGPLGGLSLRIAGAGPLEPLARQAAGAGVDYLGPVHGAAKWDLLRRAAAVVLASECYENFPLVIAEANLCGVPALVADHGGMSELVKNGWGGAAFRPRDERSFAQAAAELWRAEGGPQLRAHRQAQARAQYSVSAFLDRRLALYRSVVSCVGGPSAI